jgi:glycine cleavage system regulatory protein
VAAVLRRHGVNIADMETETVPAPWTGAPLFNLRSRLSVPRAVSIAALRRDLELLEAEHNLDLRLTPAGRMPAES